MTIFCDSKSLDTESDVEQKLLYPLLSSGQGLGYNAEEIKTKSYLQPLDIDKGAGKKVGYYPDYSIVLSSLPVLVIEAKAPNEPAESGFREAQHYAHEINKRYPSGVNPVSIVVACNGRDLIYGEWDAASPTKLRMADLSPGVAVFEAFRSVCGRSFQLSHASQVRADLHPARRFKALKLMGGPAKHHVQLPPNRFAKDLVPLLKRYFDPDATRTRKELIERAYCSTRETTHYDSVLEALLKDNLSRLKYPLFAEVETSRRDARVFNDALRQAIAKGKVEPDALLLLIGGVGVGKSMFVDRFYYHLMDQTIRANTLWAFVDFNYAPEDLSGLDSWIAAQVLNDLPQRNSLADFHGHDNLCRYFAPDIAQRTRGPYKKLAESQQEEYERRIADDLATWSDDKQKLLAGVLRYHIGDRGMRVVAVFDNADRRDRDQQLRVFQAVQHFRGTHRCFCILSLRDETYDRYQNEPPLDAYLKPFAFRISPPRFLDVAKRRLDLVIADLTSEAASKLSYALPNGITVEYPATELGDYLMGVYKSLFNPSRKVRVILEALAGRDVRRALQMFADILMSGHMTDDRIFVARYGEGVELPEWVVIRILMRTKYQYFMDEHGYVVNLFDLDEKSSTTNNFLLPEVLAALSRDRKQQGELGIEGYRHVASLIEELASRGYLAEDVLWGLEKLLKRRLVIADHQRLTGVSRDDHVKISASGYYHLAFLLGREEYLVGVCVDTWLRSRELAEEIAQHGDLKDDQHEVRYKRRRAKILALERALRKEADFHAEQSMIPRDDLVGMHRTLSMVVAAIEGRKSTPRDALEKKPTCTRGGGS